jgi:ubiquinone/menaquinone biosynthesis C-methylase UbiE
VKRVPEPEIMDGDAQALAYARADFTAVNQGFVERLLARFPGLRDGVIADVGCGPADIPLRLTVAAPALHVVAIDASPAMLRLAAKSIRARGARAVSLVCARLPDVPAPTGAFDAIISNSLLHHLPEPVAFWREIRRLGRPRAPVHAMDLFRPQSTDDARRIVDAAAANEDPILRDDFFNSLLAAYEPAEIQEQLDVAGLGHLRCEVVSERHWLVSGRL